MTGYRYPSEQGILFLTLLLIGTVLAFSAVPTLCLAPLLALGFIFLVYQLNQTQYRKVLRGGTKVTAQQTPRLAALVASCAQRLKPSPVEVFVLPERVLNAYTFGFSNPKVIVVYSPMLEVMDAEELAFVIGHEMGHVALGHSWLNTLLGGIAGVPTGLAGAVALTLAFRWWNRACEYSADRAGLLACGSLSKAVSALAQLAVGDIRSQIELQQALALLEKQDDAVGSVLQEALATHPMIIKRIHELQQWAGTAEYRRLAAQIKI